MKFERVMIPKVAKMRFLTQMDPVDRSKEYCSRIPLKFQLNSEAQCKIRAIAGTGLNRRLMIPLKFREAKES